VTQFKTGEEVFGTCRGAFAEYACASSSRLVTKPRKVTFEQAAAAPLAALTALQGLRDKGHLQAGQKVLINGAAGGVGTFAVQIAKWLGAEVTGVCSTRNVEMVRSLGANQVIDYTQSDFTQRGERYDLIFDLVANHSFLECRRVLAPTGIYIKAGVLSGVSPIGILAHSLEAPVLSLFLNQKFTTFVARSSKDDLTVVGELIATRRLTPVIDRCYGLREAPEAIRYLEAGHARGKVIIALEQSAPVG
jgi:NADPH:quinone reductase-like Zn-dependent oxidoreductase